MYWDKGLEKFLSMLETSAEGDRYFVPIDRI